MYTCRQHFRHAVFFLLGGIGDNAWVHSAGHEMNRTLVLQPWTWTLAHNRSIEVTYFENSLDNLLSFSFWSESGYPILEWTCWDSRKSVITWTELLILYTRENSFAEWVQILLYVKLSLIAWYSPLIVTRWLIVTDLKDMDYELTTINVFAGILYSSLLYWRS